MHVVWYTAMSIDGRIAGPGDDMSFLDSIDGTGEERDFEDFIASIDAILVGSGTLRWLHGQGHDLPPVPLSPGSPALSPSGPAAPTGVAPGGP